MLGRLLGEVGHAATFQRLVQAARVIGDEDQAAQRAFRHELTQLLGRRFIVERRAGLLERHLGCARFARDAHGQPAEGTLVDVPGHFQPEPGA